MIRWIVLLSLCLHVISASFDYIYEERSFMGKNAYLCIRVYSNVMMKWNSVKWWSLLQTRRMCWVWAFLWRGHSVLYWEGRWFYRVTLRWVIISFQVIIQDISIICRAPHCVAWRYNFTSDDTSTREEGSWRTQTALKDNMLHEYFMNNDVFITLNSPLFDREIPWGIKRILCIWFVAGEESPAAKELHANSGVCGDQDGDKQRVKIGLEFVKLSKIQL